MGIITVKGTDGHDGGNNDDDDDDDDDDDEPKQLPYQAMIIDIEDDEYLDIRPIRTDNIDDDDDDGDDGVDEDNEDEEEKVYSPIGGNSRSVNINEIQLYRPPKENDKVWVLTDEEVEVDDDDDDVDDNNTDNDNELITITSWKIYEVISLSPWGTADVLLSNDYLGDDEEENEITMDIRDFFLIDEEVPFIRLKQY